MTDQDDQTPVDTDRLSDAKYLLANHIATGEPLGDDAQGELLACGLVTEGDLRMLPNLERLWDPREWFEYVGSRWDVVFDNGEPVLVEQQTGPDSPPTGCERSSVIDITERGPRGGGPST